MISTRKHLCDRLSEKNKPKPRCHKTPDRCAIVSRTGYLLLLWIFFISYGCRKRTWQLSRASLSLERAPLLTPSQPRMIHGMAYATALRSMPPFPLQNQSVLKITNPKIPIHSRVHPEEFIILSNLVARSKLKLSARRAICDG